MGSRLAMPRRRWRSETSTNWSAPTRNLRALVPVPWVEHEKDERVGLRAIRHRRTFADQDRLARPAYDLLALGVLDFGLTTDDEEHLVVFQRPVLGLGGTAHRHPAATARRAGRLRPPSA